MFLRVTSDAGPVTGITFTVRNPVVEAAVWVVEPGILDPKQNLGVSSKRKRQSKTVQQQEKPDQNGFHLKIQSKKASLTGIIGHVL